MRVLVGWVEYNAGRLKDAEQLEVMLRDERPSR